VIDEAAFAVPVVRPGAATETRVVTYDGGVARKRFDAVATEEPLEIRVVTASGTRTVAITMRTPGNDFELAAGFLHNEGLIASLDDVALIDYCTRGDVSIEQRYNIVSVELRRELAPDFAPLERHFFTTSACGVCGKASIDALQARGLTALESDARVASATIVALAERLRAAQKTFAATGGLHAAGAFSLDGDLVALREDVGRHNALDKLVGRALLDRALPLRNRIVMVSGRSSYELVQKSVAAGAAIVCSVSAPSSLAVSLANEFGVTLVGFIRGERFNVYAHPERIVA